LVKITKGLLAVAAVIAAIVGYVHYSYLPVRKGRIFLERANSTVVIVREAPHMIHHIYAESLEMAVYAQGFAHAQDRLWQMEKSRKLTAGRLSEFFGEKALDMDRFSLSVGYRRMAEETWNSDLIAEEDRKMLQAYADGVNDFLDGVGRPDDSTAVYLPPEYLAVGVKEVERWHPVDTLCLISMMNFHMTQNWSMDLIRHILSSLEDGALKDLVEAVIPFSSNHNYNLTTILNDKEMGELGLLHPEKKTILQRY